MRKMTEENLKTVFAGESQAHMRYLIFANKAEGEGFPNVARLFRAIAYAEQIHAANHYNVLGMVCDTAENLQTAIDGETYEVNEVYPSFNAVAKIQEEKDAERTTNWALQAERVHAGMYQKAKQAVENGKDLNIGAIYICEMCGYTVEGEAPSRCPICGVPKEKFRKF